MEDYLNALSSDNPYLIHNTFDKVYGTDQYFYKSSGSIKPFRHHRIKVNNNKRKAQIRAKKRRKSK